MRRLGGASSDWESLGTWGVLPRDAAVQNGPALFPRIDAAQELQALEALRSPAPVPEEALCRSRCRKLPLTCSSRWR